MNPPRLSLLFSVLALLAGGTSVVGQVEPRRAPPAQVAQSAARPEQVVLSAIRSHPLTAPYPIVATWQKGKVVLSGTVGTKQVHDTAVRLAIAVGVPFRDDLVDRHRGSAFRRAIGCRGHGGRFGRATRITIIVVSLCLSPAAVWPARRPLLRLRSAAREFPTLVARNSNRPDGPAANGSQRRSSGERRLCVHRRSPGRLATARGRSGQGAG